MAAGFLSLDRESGVLRFLGKFDGKEQASPPHTGIFQPPVFLNSLIDGYEQTVKVSF
jgi:hypothetical protein